MRLEVVAANGLACARAAATAEHPAEEVAEVAEAEVLEADSAASGTGKATAVRRPERVVRLPLLLIGEDVVRRLDFLEPLLGLGVVGVPVRVVARARASGTPS